ncbi:unnamed protein product, partial [marine sediment metagenome]
MTYTLSDLTYRTARELGTVEENIATGGSTTTVEDSVNLLQVDDYWNGGTVWILWDDGDAGGAPEGQYQIITDFDDANARATFGAMTVAVKSGDRYAIAKKTYPIGALVQSVNKAIQELGAVLPIATSDITTTDLESEYAVPTSPTGVGLYDLKRVFLQRLAYADTLEDEPWIELKNWFVQTSAAGVPATILFPYDLPSGHILKCMYCIPQPELNIYSDVMSATIPVDHVVYAAAANCVNWYRQRTHS